MKKSWEGAPERGYIEHGPLLKLKEILWAGIYFGDAKRRRQNWLSVWMGDSLPGPSSEGKLGWMAKRHLLSLWLFATFLEHSPYILLWSVPAFGKKKKFTYPKQISQSVFYQYTLLLVSISLSKSLLLGQTHFFYLQLKTRTLFVFSPGSPN